LNHPVYKNAININIHTNHCKVLIRNLHQLAWKGFCCCELHSTGEKSVIPHSVTDKESLQNLGIYKQICKSLRSLQKTGCEITINDRRFCMRRTIQRTHSNKTGVKDEFYNQLTAPASGLDTHQKTLKLIHTYKLCL
jgi:hypothetical protein